MPVGCIGLPAGALGTPVRGAVEVSAANLTGQLKPVTLREITEAEAIYYIGESSVADGETLVGTRTVNPSRVRRAVRSLAERPHVSCLARRRV